jgi:tRNA (guanine37-N1)-methyltransferase
MHAEAAEPWGGPWSRWRETEDREDASVPRTRVLYLSPSGKPFDQAFAQDLAGERELVLLCGRYEGIDQRVVDATRRRVTIGDYVLSSANRGPRS